MNICSDCQGEYVLNLKHPSKWPDLCQNCRRIVGSRSGMLLKKYGLTLKQHDDIFKLQNGKCAICSIQFSSNVGRDICTDHDHHTGKIRGLLCNSCNTAIGMLRDNPKFAISAYFYLSKKRV